MVLEQSQKRGMTIECNEQQSREWDDRKGPEDLGVNFIYINWILTISLHVIIFSIFPKKPLEL